MKKLNRYKYLVTNIFWTVFLGLTACSSYSGEKAIADKIIGSSSSVTGKQTNSALTDTSAMQKDELTKIYTQAIAEFIKAVYKKDKITFDTMYFGKHVYGQPDDFPDIELPQSIDKTQIRLVAPEVGQKLQTERKSLVYANMMGWVDIEKAEFVFVVFTNGGEHQYDYFINFITNISTNNLELYKIEFENYLHLNGQKPKRIIIYEGGNYIANE